MAKLESFAPIPAKGYTNANGIDNSVKLSAMPDNGLTYSDSVFSSKVDEMDIAYIASKSCIFADNIGWKTVEPSATILYQFPVAPGVLQNKYANSPPQLYPSTLAYLASMFSFWRGGLTYRLTVAKTAFHTGRLRITYHAGISSLAGSPTTFQNAYNWVLDLSVSSEITFTIPYVSNVPWKHVRIASESGFATNEALMTGYVTVEVLTALRRASDSVTNDVPINMWISGAEDIAFAVPNFGDYAVYDYPVTPTELDDEELPRAQIFNQTTPSTSHNEQVQDDSVKVFEAPPLSLTGFEELSVGEKITNLRQVIKRFCIMNYSVPFPYLDNTTGAYIGGLDHSVLDHTFNQITLDPAYFGEASTSSTDNQMISYPTSRAGATGVVTLADYTAMIRFKSMHPLYRVSYLFRFYRGGVRYKVVSIPSIATQCTTQGFATATAGTVHGYTNVIDGVNTLPTRSALPTFAVRDHEILDNGLAERPFMDTFGNINNMQRFEHLAASDLNNVLEFEVPYYNSIPISVVCEKVVTNTDGPLIRRNKIFLRRSHDPAGMDTPITDFQTTLYGPVVRSKLTTDATSGGVTRPTFGGAYIYQAAADDFSFGYLVGPPAITQITYV
jgi:hypothetical protein